MTGSAAAVQADVRRRRSRRHSWPLVVAISLFCVSAVLPLLFMAATAFRTEADWANSRIGFPTTFSFGAFERAWTSANIGIYFRNSAIITFSTVSPSEMVMGLSVLPLGLSLCPTIVGATAMIV